MMWILMKQCCDWAAPDGESSWNDSAWLECRSIISLILHQQLTNERSGNPPPPITAALWETHSPYRPNQSELLPSKQHVSIPDCKGAHNMSCFECYLRVQSSPHLCWDVIVFCVTSQVNRCQLIFRESC